MMKQYNRLMLGERSKYVQECIEGNFVGTNFLPGFDLTTTDITSENDWRKTVTAKYLEAYPERSVATARTSAGFLWTVSFGLKENDIVLTPNGNGEYRVGIITGSYYYRPGECLPHRRPVTWLDKVIPRAKMSQKLRYSAGSIGTCCNLTKYSSELESLLGDSGQYSTPAPSPAKDTTNDKNDKDEKYKERALHRLLANHLRSQRNILTKTIFHESSKKSDQNQKWIHPDMVGVSFSEFQEKPTVDLLKATDIKQYVDLYSFELKCAIRNDHELKAAFFQALSNSNWANFGYLAAFQINDDLMEEMERLNRAFGIGIIRISPYETDTIILYPARRNDVDYYTIDKLCRVNQDFKRFMERTARVLNAQTEMLEDVKGGLELFCDKGFDNDKELADYCTEHHIPLSD